MEKTKYIVITSILLGILFTCTHFVEKYIESLVSEKLQTLPFTIGKLKYKLFSQRLTLSDFNFEYSLQNKARDNISISIQKIAIEDFNTSLNSIEDGIPQVFDALYLHDVLVSLKSKDSVMASMHVETYNIEAYSQNYKKLITEYKKSPISEQFFTELLAFKHEGIEKLGAFFIFYDANAEQKATLYMKRAFLYPMNTAQSLSLLYEGIAWKAPLVALEGASIQIDDVRIPSPKDLSTLALALQHDISTSTSSVWPRLFPKIFLENIVTSKK